MDSRRFNYDPDARPDKARYSLGEDRLEEANSVEHSLNPDDDSDEAAARGLAALDALDSGEDPFCHDRKEAARSIAQGYGPVPSPSLVQRCGPKPSHSIIQRWGLEPTPSVVLHEPVQPARSVVRQSHYPRNRSPSSSSEDGEVMLKASLRFRNKVVRSRIHTPVHELLLKPDQDYQWRHFMSASWRVLSNHSLTHPLQLTLFQPRMIYYAPVQFGNVYFAGPKIRDPSRDTVFIKGRDQSRNMWFLIRCSSVSQPENRWDFQVIPSDDHNFILSAFRLGLRHGTLELQIYVESIARPWKRVKDWALTTSLKIESLIGYNVGEFFITEATAELHKQYTTLSTTSYEVFIRDGALQRHRVRRQLLHPSLVWRSSYAPSVEIPALSRIQ
jgi:hypothetical protein